MTRLGLQVGAQSTRTRSGRGGPLKSLSVVQWVRHVPRGEILFHQGDPAEGAFVVSRGRMRIYMSSATGTSRELAEARAGEIVGLSAAIAGKSHQASAEALSACTVGFIRRDDLLHLIRQESEVCFYVLQCLSADISASYGLLRDLVTAHGRHNHHPEQVQPPADHATVEPEPAEPAPVEPAPVEPAID